jgi:TolB protein
MDCFNSPQATPLPVQTTRRFPRSQALLGNAPVRSSASRTAQGSRPPHTRSLNPQPPALKPQAERARMPYCGCVHFTSQRIAFVLLLLIVVSARTLAADEERLTNDGRLKFSPVYCDEGKALVYVDLETPTLMRLQRFTLADRTIQPLHKTAATSEFEPAFSADGSAYAFLQTRGVLSIHLVVRDPEQRALADISPGEGFAGFRSPAISPDRRRIAVSFAEKGRQQIFSIPTSGGQRTPLTDSRGVNNWPAWSPDGSRIVFSSSRDDDFEIYVMNADGSDPIRLTRSPGQDIRPRFSPDGKRIAFTSHRDRNAEIYVMNADGTSTSRLTENADRDDYPDWHPDGRRLVIVGERGGRHDLYLISATGPPQSNAGTESTR